MVYDPQANRRRPKPEAQETAPVDAILGDAPTPVAPKAAADDPPPIPAVTPAPADPIPDTLLLSSGVVTAFGGLVALLTLRHFWKRRQAKSSDDQS